MARKIDTVITDADTRVSETTPTIFQAEPGWHAAAFSLSMEAKPIDPSIVQEFPRVSTDRRSVTLLRVIAWHSTDEGLIPLVATMPDASANSMTFPAVPIAEAVTAIDADIPDGSATAIDEVLHYLPRSHAINVVSGKSKRRHDEMWQRLRDEIEAETAATQVTHTTEGR